MTLKNALEIGQNCGLETVGECMLNIRMHAISLFSYSEIHDELNELNAEFRKLQDSSNIHDNTLISAVLELVKG